LRLFSTIAGKPSGTGIIAVFSKKPRCSGSLESFLYCSGPPPPPPNFGEIFSSSKSRSTSASLSPSPTPSPPSPRFALASLPTTPHTGVAARGHSPDPASATSPTRRVICRRAAGGRPPARSSPPPPSPPPAPAKNRWRASPWCSSHAPPRSPPLPAPPPRSRAAATPPSAPATANKERPSRQRRSTHHGGDPGEHRIGPIPSKGWIHCGLKG
ncbi:unnamed protein product, partial [Urochloa humidicola]